MNVTLEQSLELNRRITAGEFSDDDAIAELIRIGVPDSLARKRVGTLTGKRKELEIPATASPDGEEPLDASVAPANAGKRSG